MLCYPADSVLPVFYIMEQEQVRMIMKTGFFSLTFIYLFFCTFPLTLFCIWLRAEGTKLEVKEPQGPL